MATHQQGTVEWLPAARLQWDTRWMLAGVLRHDGADQVR